MATTSTTNLLRILSEQDKEASRTTTGIANLPHFSDRNSRSRRTRCHSPEGVPVTVSLGANGETLAKAILVMVESTNWEACKVTEETIWDGDQTVTSEEISVYEISEILETWPRIYPYARRIGEIAQAFWALPGWHDSHSGMQIKSVCASEGKLSVTVSTNDTTVPRRYGNSLVSPYPEIQVTHEFPLSQFSEHIQEAISV